MNTHDYSRRASHQLDDRVLGGDRFGVTLAEAWPVRRVERDHVAQMDPEPRGPRRAPVRRPQCPCGQARGARAVDQLDSTDSIRACTRRQTRADWRRVAITVVQERDSRQLTAGGIEQYLRRNGTRRRTRRWGPADGYQESAHIVVLVV